VVPAIGASGAISGVLGAYLFLHPNARIQTLIFFGFFARFIYVPAWVFLPIWFLIQFFSGITSLRVADPQAGGVAFFAHIGGFVAGPLLLFLLGGGRRPPQAEPAAWR
jgi:membrane associated rhomboid family serine protease